MLMFNVRIFSSMGQIHILASDKNNGISSTKTNFNS